MSSISGWDFRFYKVGFILSLRKSYIVWPITSETSESTPKTSIVLRNPILGILTKNFCAKEVIQTWTALSSICLSVPYCKVSGQKVYKRPVLQQFSCLFLPNTKEFPVPVSLTITHSVLFFTSKFIIGHTLTVVILNISSFKNMAYIAKKQKGENVILP